MSFPTSAVHELPSFLGILIPNAKILKPKVEGQKSNLKLKLTIEFNDIGTKGLDKVYCNERFKKFLYYSWVQ
jgi:hypothetical protein